MSNSGAMQVDTDKLSEAKNALDSLARDIESKIDFMNMVAWNNINEHDNCLGNKSIEQYVTSGINDVSGKIKKLSGKIQDAYHSICIWDDHANISFQEAASKGFLSSFTTVSGVLNLNQMIKFKDKNGKVVEMKLKDYGNYLLGLTNSKTTTNGVKSKVSSNTSNKAIGAATIATNTVFSTVKSNASNVSNNQSSGTVTGNSNSVNSQIPSNGGSSNNSNNSVVNIVDNNKSDNSKDKENNNNNKNNNVISNVSGNKDVNNNIGNDSINSNTGNSNTTTPIVDNKSDSVVNNISNVNSNTSKPNNSNNSGFGSLFNKNDDYKTPNISTSVGGVVDSGTPGSLPLDGNDVSISKPGDFGNLFDNDNISSSNTGTIDSGSNNTSKSSGFNPIPLGVGLGLATAVGVGAKVIHDHKKNSEFDNDDQVESFGGNKFWSDDDLSVVHSEEDSFIDDSLERFNSNEETDLSSGYSASYSNDLESQVPDNNLWTLEDEDLKNNEQIVDLLNGN